MKKSLIVTLWTVAILFAIIGLITFFTVIFNPVYFNFSWKIDTQLANNFGQFFGGLIGTIFSITSTILILLTLILQNQDLKKKQTEEHFFKMIDFHNENVRSLSVKHIIDDRGKSDGRRAFVVFRMQLQALIMTVREIESNLRMGLRDNEIIDIAYICFYYGINDDEEWSAEINEKLSRYTNSNYNIAELLVRTKEKLRNDKKINIGRTNQTSLSSYYRNMYNAIKFVDEEKSLTEKEKKKLVTIYRAQLSNPEIYVLFMNLLSRFGKNWIEKNYIIKYEFIKNLPLTYCKDINPKEFFDIEYEDEELD